MLSHTCEYCDCTLVCIDTFVCDEHPASAADAIARPAAQARTLRLISMVRINPFRSFPLSSLAKVACGAFADISCVSAGKKRGFCRLRRAIVELPSANRH